jgi:predicted SAM-dependent methyltransferase
VADEVSAFHLIEHFARYEATDVLAEWRRLLKPGGRLILELPNLELACRNLLDGLEDSLGLRPIYGDWTHRDPYMLHKHGYTPKTISALLQESGFVQIEMKPPQTHGRQLKRDMRVEAIRG